MLGAVCVCMPCVNSVKPGPPQLADIRRARVWDRAVKEWNVVAPFQEWEDGEVWTLALSACPRPKLFAAMLTIPTMPGPGADVHTVTL
jgi:hypothetical protein